MSTDVTPVREAGLQKLNAMIEGIETAMLTTAEPGGTLHCRPMAAQRFPTDGTLWFFTRIDAPKVDEVQQDWHVNVAFSAPERKRFVSISGRARVLRDRAVAERLWNPNVKTWFPGGLDDPALALLKVEIERAEYWDAPTDAMTLIKDLAGALVSGREFQPGENARIDLTGR